MAMVFGGGTDSIVSVTAAASINALDDVSYLMWINVTTLTNGRVIFDKRDGSGNLGPQLRISGTGGDLRFQHSAAGGGTNRVLTTSSTPLVTTGAWRFLAVRSRFSSSAATIYVGSATSPPTNCTYSTDQASVGTVGDDSPNPLRIVNNSAVNVPMQGSIAVMAVFNRSLTDNEVNNWYVRPQIISGCVFYSHFGFNGVGIVEDYSGNGNRGTPAGTVTLGAHAPLGPAFNWPEKESMYVVAAAGTTVRPRSLLTLGCGV